MWFSESAFGGLCECYVRADADVEFVRLFDWSDVRYATDAYVQFPHIAGRISCWAGCLLASSWWIVGSGSSGRCQCVYRAIAPLFLQPVLPVLLIQRGRLSQLSFALSRIGQPDELLLSSQPPHRRGMSEMTPRAQMVHRMSCEGCMR